MGYAFISYSSADLDKANAVRDLFLSKNIDCWMAKYDIQQNFPEELGQKIGECSCFVLLLTDSAQKSKWVSKEVALSISFDKKILPVRLEKGFKLNYAFSTYLADIHIEPVDEINEKDFGMSRVLRKVISFAGVKESEKKQQKENVVEKKQAAKETKSVNNSDIDIDSLLAYYGDNQITKEVKAEKEEASDIVTVVEKDGYKYVGQMKDGKYHGKGTQYRPDGSKLYEGNWVNSKQHGKGTQYRSDGSKWYEGDWVNGCRHGKGTFYYEHGGRYKGDWVIGLKHGKGTFYYNNGEIYEGGWVNGVPHGEGTYYWKNGDKYIGEWKNNKRNGWGTFYYADGRTEEHYYKNDELKKTK